MFKDSKLLERKGMNSISNSEISSNIVSLADYKPLTLMVFEFIVHILKRFWGLCCLLLISIGIFFILYTNLPQKYEPSISERILIREYIENSVEKSISNSKNIQNERVEKIQSGIGIESNIDIPESKREEEEILLKKLIKLKTVDEEFQLNEQVNNVHFVNDFTVYVSIIQIKCDVIGTTIPKLLRR